MKQDSGDRRSQFDGAGSSAAAAVLPAARDLDAASVARPGANTAVPVAVDPEWLEATFSRLDLLLYTLAGSQELGRLLLRELAPAIGAAQAALYVLGARAASEASQAGLVLAASYAAGPELPERWNLGEGLVGQCARDGQKLVVRGVPSEHFRVRSGLGTSAPLDLAIVPVWITTAELGVIELAFVGGLTPAQDALLDRLVTRRPQAMEARDSAPPPASPAGGSRTSLRVGQRSGFWGKLSHELRSPLNSVLVLSQLLVENAEANLTAKQVAFATAIHNSGNDLLALVNAISDLAKIQNGRLVLEPTEMTLAHFRSHLERAFLPLAAERGLQFGVELGPGLPEVIVTDAKRVRQILKCLLSNAFKFTESGGVRVQVGVRSAGWPVQHEQLSHARQVVAISVSDTGVGISESEQQSIFDAFPPEQVEARRGAGASGLGLAISQGLARLLGGVLLVESGVGKGSTFTLFLPVSGLARAAPVEPPPESGPARQARDSGWMLVAPPQAPAGGHSASAESAAPPRGQHEAGPRRLRPALLLGHNILLVDDDVRSAFAMTGALERQGAEVSHAEGIGEAMQRLEAGLLVSAVLLDAELFAGGVQGTLSALLSHCDGLPVIALTGAAASGVFFPPGVVPLSKPVDAQQLAQVLTAVVPPPAAL